METYVKQLEACNTILQHERMTLQDEVRPLRRELAHVVLKGTPFAPRLAHP